jgi:hypothetical protein
LGNIVLAVAYNGFHGFEGAVLHLEIQRPRLSYDRFAGNKVLAVAGDLAEP